MAYSQARFLADNEMFEHSEKEERRHADGFCGENLAEAIVWHDEYKRPNGEDVTTIWYNESENYDYEAGGFHPDCAQFTQLIWRATRMFGIAFAEYEPSDAKGFVKTVIVANYFPCGNVENQFKENIGEPMQTSGPDQQSKLQRKIEQYRRKKARHGNQKYSIFGGRQVTSPGNLA
ncbi:Golgi-associated plant pathogenesis-related protein 1-like [Watersipora subatra]|uniref:Golgi-associated plant pathogenesis-related protein 1-like n=1 Tax=Watersipora subatra TaxID=2589382 RepID=UPI00355B851F